MKRTCSDVLYPIRRHCSPIFVRALLPATLFILAVALSMTVGCGTTGKSLTEAPGTALEAAPEPILNEMEQQANAESFDKAWQTINDTFWDPEFRGVDWTAVRETYTPLIAAAPTRSEATHPERGSTTYETDPRTTRGIPLLHYSSRTLRRHDQWAQRKRRMWLSRACHRWTCRRHEGDPRFTR